MSGIATARTAGAPARARSPRKRLYALHTWVGFHLAWIMALVLATGTLATLSNEIDWLIHEELRAVPDGERVPLPALADAARAFRPDHTLISLSSMGGDQFSWRARMADPFGRQTFVHVDPWSGAVTGEVHPLTVQRFFRDLHRYLFMPNYLGLPIVTAMAFVLAISLYTGLKTARNWRTLAFRVRTERGLRVAVGDAHKAAGLWASWFFMVMIVTGIWYLLEFGAAAAGQRMQPAGPRLETSRLEATGPVLEPAGAAAWLAAAREAFPELEPTMILYPLRPDAPVQVQGSVGNPFLRERANRVFLDPETAAVLHVQRAAEIPLVAYLNELADPLHFGYFGGLPAKLIWFVFGLAMTGLSLSGVWLTWRRLHSLSPSRAQLATVPVLLLCAGFFFPWYSRLQGPDVPPGTAVLDRARSAGVEATLELALDKAGRPGAELILAARGESGYPLLTEAAVEVAGTRHAARPRRFGEHLALRIALPQEALREGDPVRATLAFRGDTRIELEGSLPR